MKKYLKRVIYIQGNQTFFSFCKTINPYFTKVLVTIAIEKDIYTNGSSLNNLLDNWGVIVSEKIIEINADKPKKEELIYKR